MSFSEDAHIAPVHTTHQFALLLFYPGYHASQELLLRLDSQDRKGQGPGTLHYEKCGKYDGKATRRAEAYIAQALASSPMKASK